MAVSDGLLRTGYLNMAVSDVLLWTGYWNMAVSDGLLWTGYWKVAVSDGLLWKDIPPVLPYKRQGMCCKYWATLNFSRRGKLCEFVCQHPHIIPVEVKIFVPVSPWRQEKVVIGQLHAPSTLLLLTDLLN
jgi:hypothetical protein